MKRTLIFALMLLLALPGLASAHSYMEQSVPAKDEAVTASPGQISMTFNTDIEKLSSFKLFNEAGEEMPVGDIAVNGAVLSGTVTEPLANGAYTVKWAIIGEDGHTVNGEYAFTVAAEEQPASPSPSLSPTASPDAAASPEASAESTTAPAPSASPDADSGAAAETEGQNPNMGAAIAIGVIIIAAAVILILRSRRK